MKEKLKNLGRVLSKDDQKKIKGWGDLANAIVNPVGCSVEYEGKECYSAFFPLKGYCRSNGDRCGCKQKDGSLWDPYSAECSNIA